MSIILRGEFLGVDAIPVKDNKVMNVFKVLNGDTSETIVISEKMFKDFPKFDKFQTVSVEIKVRAFKSKNGDARLGMDLVKIGLAK